MVDTRALATVSGVGHTTSFCRGSSLLVAGACITGGVVLAVVNGIIGCSFTSWITTEDLEGCIGHHSNLPVSEMSFGEVEVPGLGVFVNKLHLLQSKSFRRPSVHPYLWYL